MVDEFSHSLAAEFRIWQNLTGNDGTTSWHDTNLL
jgi:hypothetical protein